MFHTTYTLLPFTHHPAFLRGKICPPQNLELMSRGPNSTYSGLTLNPKGPKTTHRAQQSVVKLSLWYQNWLLEVYNDSQIPKIEHQDPKSYIVGQKSTPRYLKFISRSTKCTPKILNRVPEAKNQPEEAKTRLTTGKINRTRQKIKGPFNFKVRL